LDGATGLNILFLGAHCDDIEIGCGGTIHRLLREYPINHIKWVVFCSNEIREREARNCAEEFLKGVASKEIIIRDFRDGYLSQQYTEVKDFFEQLKQEINPDIVFTHYQHDLHQDHRLLSQLAWDTLRDHRVLVYGIPKCEGDTGRPACLVVVAEKDVRAKVRKLADCYASQRHRLWFDEDTLVSILRLPGLQSASRYAEAFY